LIRSGASGYDAAVTVHGEHRATPLSWVVDVEVLALSVREGQLHHRCLTATLRSPASPHDVAREMAGLRLDDRAALCHSTSWRVEEDHRVVLTYAALPDPDDHAARPFAPSLIVAASDPVSPQPEMLRRENVLTHALRHLAMLSREDPTIGALVPRHPELWEAIRQAAARAVTAREDQLRAG
jgi:hypothetical protein